MKKKIKKTLGKSILYSLVFWGFLFTFILPAKDTLKEKLATIAAESNFNYYKPEVCTAPGGVIYVAYEAKNKQTGVSDIYLGKYENDKASFIKNISESPARSYEVDIAAPADGSIHIAWIDQADKNIVAKYRCFNGSAWSDIYTFGELKKVDFVEDLRIAVDKTGNVFVVFTHFPGAKCWLYSKYGNNIISEDFPFDGRAKHAEMRADEKYVYMAWQYFQKDLYTIAFSKRPNKPRSSWTPWQDIGHYGTQRPRLQMGLDNTLHLCYAFKTGSSRKMFYKGCQGEGFGLFEEISPSETFHFFDMAAVDANNVIVTMQKGSGSGGKNVGCNWKRNGVWSGYKAFPGTASREPAWQSIALTPDGGQAVLAFAERDAAVHLVFWGERGEEMPNEPPIALFTISPTEGISPLEIQVDASAASDPDGRVESYRWDFGDGGSGSGKTAAHTYAQAGDFTVVLTVTDDQGLTGSGSSVVSVTSPGAAGDEEPAGDEKPTMRRITCSDGTTIEIEYAADKRSFKMTVTQSEKSMVESSTYNLFTKLVEDFLALLEYMCRLTQ